MEYWTILWMTVMGGALDGAASSVLYTSLASCERATVAVSQTVNYDHGLECEETTFASRSIRPRPRPEGLSQ